MSWPLWTCPPRPAPKPLVSVPKSTGPRTCTTPERRSCRSWRARSRRTNPRNSLQRSSRGSRAGAVCWTLAEAVGAADRHCTGGEERSGNERADARASFERGGDIAFEGRCASSLALCDAGHTATPRPAHRTASNRGSSGARHTPRDVLRPRAVDCPSRPRRPVSARAALPRVPPPSMTERRTSRPRAGRALHPDRPLRSEGATVAGLRPLGRPRAARRLLGVPGGAIVFPASSARARRPAAPAAVAGVNGGYFASAGDRGPRRRPRGRRPAGLRAGRHRSALLVPRSPAAG